MEKRWNRLDIDGIPPGKQGKFDRVYEGPNGEVHVIEAKGVASGEPSFGTRVSASDEVVQQGTAAYREDIVVNLLNKLPQSSDLRIKLAEFVQNGESISYVLVRQKTLLKDKFVHKVFIE